MKCCRPFVQGVAEFGCGQCMPCLMNRRRLWTARLMLEARKHEFSYFVTLTYNKENLPVDESVSPKELQLFLKRLRWKCAPREIRFYGVGEYGERGGRPHYHLALFGMPTVNVDECRVMVESAWGKGNVHVGSLTPDSAGYIVSYICKAWTKTCAVGLNGRHPEFARMSRRPGIGAYGMSDFARVIKGGVDVGTGEIYGLPDGDVPMVFRYNGSEHPLGRYLRSKIRLALGFASGEPKISGQLRNFRRAVDLRAAGHRGFLKSIERRSVSLAKAMARFRITQDRKGL